MTSEQHRPILNPIRCHLKKRKYFDFYFQPFIRKKINCNKLYKKKNILRILLSLNQTLNFFVITNFCRLFQGTCKNIHQLINYLNKYINSSIILNQEDDLLIYMFSHTILIQLLKYFTNHLRRIIYRNMIIKTNKYD